MGQGNKCLIRITICGFIAGKKAQCQQLEAQSLPVPERKTRAKLVQNHEFAPIILTLPFQNVKVTKQGFQTIVLTF
jgi:hypothetical protein